MVKRKKKQLITFKEAPTQEKLTSFKSRYEKAVKALKDLLPKIDEKIEINIEQHKDTQKAIEHFQTLKDNPELEANFPLIDQHISFLQTTYELEQVALNNADDQKAALLINARELMRKASVTFRTLIDATISIKSTEIINRSTNTGIEATKLAGAAMVKATEETNQAVKLTQEYLLLSVIPQASLQKVSGLVKKREGMKKTMAIEVEISR